MTMDPRIITSFECWFKTGSLLEEPVFSDFNPKNVLEIFNLKPPAVFLLLDWIRREPTEALKALSSEYNLTLPIRKRKFSGNVPATE
jgi:hypothetical protein